VIPIQHTVFTPDLRTAGGEIDGGLKTGTTTIGIVCKDCVVLAADRRATAGNLIANKKTEKVRPVTRHIGITIAGSVSDLQRLYKYLTVELKLKEMRDGREATVKEAASLLSTWVYHLIRSSYGIAHFLVGGYDSAPRLYDVYPDGSSMEMDDYVTSGSGSVFALGVLENKFKPGLSREDGVKLAVEAMSASLARDSASGNGIDVYVIGKDGAEKVVSKAIEPKI
jgi:proteasome beta subunit